MASAFGSTAKEETMSKMRIESDSLGDVELPESALYGAQTQRAVDNFNFYGRTLPVTFIRTLALIKKAAAQTNQELHCIEPEQAEAIIWGCDKIIQGEYLDQFPVNVFQTGSGTSSNMNMNEVVATLANQFNQNTKLSVKNESDVSQKIHPNDHVNYGQSSNDVIPTCIQVSAVVACQQQLIPALEKLSERLSLLAEKNQSVVKTGRTHLMDAMPLSLGDEFKTWAFQLKESRERIDDSLIRVSQLPLGGTAIGTGINTHKEFAVKVAHSISQLTTFDFSSSENLASRISAQDATLELHGQLKVLATVLIKQANDIRWMNSGPNCGLSEIQLKALQPGSSIMPGKVNPVIAEAVLMMCTEVIGNDTSITIANQSGNFQLNVMLPLIADKVLASISLLSDAMTAMADKGLTGIVVNQAVLKEQAANNPILATALNPMIGYEAAAKIAKQAMKEKRNILSVAKEETNLSDEELGKILDPAKLAKPFE